MNLVETFDNALQSVSLHSSIEFISESACCRAVFATLSEIMKSLALTKGGGLM